MDNKNTIIIIVDEKSYISNKITIEKSIILSAITTSIELNNDVKSIDVSDGEAQSAAFSLRIALLL